MQALHLDWDWDWDQGCGWGLEWQSNPEGHSRSRTPPPLNWPVSDAAQRHPALQAARPSWDGVLGATVSSSKHCPDTHVDGNTCRHPGPAEIAD